MYNLLEKIDGDITNAVSKFYEHETKFWEKIVAATKMNPKVNKDPTSEKFVGDKLSEQSDSISNATMASK